MQRTGTVVPGYCPAATVYGGGVPHASIDLSSMKARIAWQPGPYSAGVRWGRAIVRHLLGMVRGLSGARQCRPFVNEGEDHRAGLSSSCCRVWGRVPHASIGLSSMRAGIAGPGYLRCCCSAGGGANERAWPTACLLDCQLNIYFSCPFTFFN